MDALPVDEAYWAAARELFPFIDIARPVPVERDRDGKGARRNHKWRKADERTRRALAQLDKRWRLSLAGLDPMTGRRPGVVLPTFIVQPQTNAKQAIVENARWLNPNESIRSPCFARVSTADGGKSFAECRVLVDRNDFERWLDNARIAKPKAKEKLEASVSKLERTLSGSQLSAGEHPVAEAKVRRRGQKPRKLEQVKEAMRHHIQEGRFNKTSLGAMLEKNLADLYGVSRDTARKARNAILSEIVGN